MLYNVAEGMQKMAFNVIRNHPNAWSVQVLRKVIDRAAPVAMGMPTIGGIGVLDSQDEVSFHYEHLANACALPAEMFQGQGMSMAERGDAPIGQVEEFLYMLAPEPADPVPGQLPLAVEFKTKDVVLFVLGDTTDAARLAFEIAAVEATVNLPPYLPRYVLNRRFDMNLPVGGVGP